MNPRWLRKTTLTTTYRSKTVKKKTACPSEHTEQVNFINWFRSTYPDVLIFSIPNGGKRHKLTAYKLKQEGAVSGIPDMFIPAWAAFIEMKREKGGVVSSEQKDIIKHLTAIGYIAIVCKGSAEAIKFCTEFNNKRERLKNEQH